MRAYVSGFVLCVCLAATSAVAYAQPIFESATGGGSIFGVTIDEDRWLGVSFTTDEEELVGTVTVNVGSDVASLGEAFFVGIYPAAAVEAAAPLSADGAAFLSLIFPEEVAGDESVDVNQVLPPGEWVVVIGSGLAGATGTGFAPDNHTNLLNYTMITTTDRHWNVPIVQDVDGTSGVRVAVERVEPLYDSMDDEADVLALVEPDDITPPRSCGITVHTSATLDLSNFAVLVDFEAAATYHWVVFEHSATGSHSNTDIVYESADIGPVDDSDIAEWKHSPLDMFELPPGDYDIGIVANVEGTYPAGFVGGAGDGIEGLGIAPVFENTTTPIVSSHFGDSIPSEESARECGVRVYGARCGNEAIEFGEECDDGDTVTDVDDDCDAECQDVDECLAGTDDCDGTHEECVNLVGNVELGFECQCESGYEYNDSGTCVDIDECLACTHDCATGESCDNTDGGFTCTCDEPGYEVDEGVCDDIDECEAGVDGGDACEAGEDCYNACGDYRCDVDECAAGSDDCGDNQDCNNLIGSENGFYCTCAVGYADDTKTIGVLDCVQHCGVDGIQPDFPFYETCDTGIIEGEDFVAGCRPGFCTYCGDGTLDPSLDDEGNGEECDDGNDADDDACVDCELQPGWYCYYGFGAEDLTCEDICGNGIADEYEDCLIPFGVDEDECLLQRNNACDDGNTLDGDGCSANCNYERGWACEEVTEEDGSTDVTCEVDCGDGFVFPDAEECDDGNDVADDGCTSCVVDDGWSCAEVRVCDRRSCELRDSLLGRDDQRKAPGSVCRETCGNGELDDFEACEDTGAATDDDGCSASCQPEDGWDCVTGDDGVFEGCDAVCGDGLLVGDEPCDDGDENTDTEPDGCRDVDGVCTDAFCGDAVIDTSETCDDGSDNSDTEPDACRTDCVPADCGDGAVDSAEECDEGEDNSDDGTCLTDCTLAAVCGDEIVDEGEECDDGDANSDSEADACRTDCSEAGCGDGVVDTGEACDDGADGSATCSATCETIEEPDPGPETEPDAGPEPDAEPGTDTTLDETPATEGLKLTGGDCSGCNEGGAYGALNGLMLAAILGIAGLTSKLRRRRMRA